MSEELFSAAERAIVINHIYLKIWNDRAWAFRLAHYVLNGSPGGQLGGKKPLTEQEDWELIFWAVGALDDTWNLHEVSRRLLAQIARKPMTPVDSGFEGELADCEEYINTPPDDFA